MHARMSTGTVAICCARAAPWRYGWDIASMPAVAACHAARYHWPSCRLSAASRITRKRHGLSVAAARCTDGGLQHYLHRLVGHGLRAEVAYGSLAVDGVEERHVCVGHGVPPSTVSATK